MFELSPIQAKRAVFNLACLHIFIIASSNYLVQIPFTVLGIHATWGSLTFPFIFLTTDLTVKILGQSIARKIIFCCMFPAIILSYIISMLFVDGQWLGFSGLLGFNPMVFRIALASFLAYVSGQLLDILVFNRLRQLPKWWPAPVASAIVGNGLDTAVFFFIAFFHSSDVFMYANWIQIAWVDYLFKLIICGLFFLPLYGVLLNFLSRRVLR